MNIALFEDAGYERLLPLTWLRAGCELRCGCDRLLDKVGPRLGGKVVRVWTREAIRSVVTERLDLPAPAPKKDWCLLSARALVTEATSPPPMGVAWQRNGELVGVRVPAEDVQHLEPEFFFDEVAVAGWLAGFRIMPPPPAVGLINYPWELPLANGDEIRRQCRAGGSCEGRVYPGVHMLNPGEIHVARGATVKPGVVLDAEIGPIHIEHGARIESNAVVIGPCHIGADSVVQPLTHIRENTSVGPACRVGGEIANSIIHGRSNKQHDGFLGHSYVGEWANLGAATVTSNLKNTYGTIRVSINGVGIETGQTFVGATIGDHAKTGIGTILPTGAVLGVAANVFTTTAVPKFMPSFSWLTEAGLVNYRIDKALHIIRTVMGRRHVDLSAEEEELIRYTAERAREIEAAGW